MSITSCTYIDLNGHYARDLMFNYSGKQIDVNNKPIPSQSLCRSCHRQSNKVLIISSFHHKRLMLMTEEKLVCVWLCGLGLLWRPQSSIERAHSIAIWWANRNRGRDPINLSSTAYIFETTTTAILQRATRLGPTCEHYDPACLLLTVIFKWRVLRVMRMVRLG